MEQTASALFSFFPLCSRTNRKFFRARCSERGLTPHNVLKSPPSCTYLSLDTAAEYGHVLATAREGKRRLAIGHYSGNAHFRHLEQQPAGVKIRDLSFHIVDLSVRLWPDVDFVPTGRTRV